MKKHKVESTRSL